MTQSYIVLYDFSTYARQALRIAHLWSSWTGAELHLLHNLEAAYVPAMANQDIRQQVESGFRTEAYHKLQHNYQEITGQPAHPKNIHITVTSFTPTLENLVREHNAQLLFAGLKGNGVLKRIFIGSTILKLLDYTTIPLVAIPRHLRMYEHISLHIGVSYHYTFNTSHLQQFVQLMEDRIQSINFISVLTKDDDRKRATSHLAKLKSNFPDRANVSTCLFEGKDPFDQVKAYMKDQEDGVLLVQKGSRALSDYLFRAFFINELVHDASIPLIILPS